MEPMMILHQFDSAISEGLGKRPIDTECIRILCEARTRYVQSLDEQLRTRIREKDYEDIAAPLPTPQRFPSTEVSLEAHQAALDTLARLRAGGHNTAADQLERQMEAGKMKPTSSGQIVQPPCCDGVPLDEPNMANRTMP